MGTLIGVIKKVVEHKETVMILAVGLIFVIFIWPTLYKYEHLRRYEGEFLVKINRVTGNAHMLTLNGWVMMKPSEPETITVQAPMSSAAAPSVE